MSDTSDSKAMLLGIELTLVGSVLYLGGFPTIVDLIGETALLVGAFVFFVGFSGAD